MPEPSWIFILAMTTFALVIAFILFSLVRTKRDQKNDETTEISRADIAEAREENIGSAMPKRPQ